MTTWRDIAIIPETRSLARMPLMPWSVSFPLARGCFWPAAV